MLRHLFALVMLVLLDDDLRTKNATVQVRHGFALTVLVEIDLMRAVEFSLQLLNLLHLCLVLSQLLHVVLIDSHAVAIVSLIVV